MKGESERVTLCMAYGYLYCLPILGSSNTNSPGCACVRTTESDDQVIMLSVSSVLSIKMKCVEVEERWEDLALS